MKRTMFWGRANQKKKRALNSDNNFKTLVETYSNILQREYTILTWGLGFFGSTSGAFTTGVLCSPINFG